MLNQAAGFIRSCELNSQLYMWHNIEERFVNDFCCIPCWGYIHLPDVSKGHKAALLSLLFDNQICTRDLCCHFQFGEQMCVCVCVRCKSEMAILLQQKCLQLVNVNYRPLTASYSISYSSLQRLLANTLLCEVINSWLICPHGDIEASQISPLE